jgi:hypothetical protein
VIPEVKAPKTALSRAYIFRNTIFSLAWRSLTLGIYIFLKFTEGVGESDLTLKQTLSVLGIGLVIALLISLPGLVKALWFFLRNGPIAGHMKQIGKALAKTLCHIGVIKTDINQLQVITQQSKEGHVFCGLEGGSSYEKTLFLDCLQEILEPIENPRYLLIRKSRFKLVAREDFHSVPSIIGAKKESAEFFSLMWKKHVGKNELVYTRNLGGRQVLLSARRKSLSAGFQKRSERVDRWR